MSQEKWNFKLNLTILGIFKNKLWKFYLITILFNIKHHLWILTVQKCRLIFRIYSFGSKIKNKDNKISIINFCIEKKTFTGLLYIGNWELLCYGSGLDIVWVI